MFFIILLDSPCCLVDNADMTNKGFVLLWSTILDSSVWMQDAPTRLVWITMLAMKDADGVVKASVPGLAHRARVALDECRTALAIFASPDPDSTSRVEEGRRIKEVPGGWFVINHEMYRFSSDERREAWRQQKAEQRAKKAAAEPGKRKEKLYGTPKTFEEKRQERLEKPEDEDGPIPP